jgi:hypothetical protein
MNWCWLIVNISSDAMDNSFLKPLGAFKVSGCMFLLHFLVATFDLIGREQLNK